jgi:peptidoglycan-associated lipoprotein
MRNIFSFAVTVISACGLVGCAHKPPASPQTQEGQSVAPVAAQRIVPGSAEDFVAAAGDRVFFGYDQYTLQPDAREALARQAAWLKQYSDVRIMVAGNCDERGTREYNLALGARRANAVRDYLNALGIEYGRIETTSYGKDRPIDTRANEEGWAVNRNAHTQLVNPRVS